MSYVPIVLLFYTLLEVININNYEKISLLVTISKLYYEYNMSQQKISEKINISRTYVSKLLSEAKKMGIVKLQIIDPLESESGIETELRKKFGLHRAIVIPTEDNDPFLRKKLGEAAANYLNLIIESNDIIGVSWGQTLYDFSKCILPRTDLDGITVVQLCGGISKIMSEIYTSEIVQNIANALEGISCLIPLPAVLDNEETRNAIIKDKHIADVLSIARHTSIAIFTVGVFDETNSFVRAGYFNNMEIKKILSTGTVGDICSHIIDARGALCSDNIEKRTIAISLNDLKLIRKRICITAGLQKHECTLACLRAGYMTTLVTNEAMASWLLLQ